jgi:hypothetical protein
LRASRRRGKIVAGTPHAPSTSLRRLCGSIAASNSGLNAGGADAVEQEDKNEVCLLICSDLLSSSLYIL